MAKNSQSCHPGGQNLLPSLFPAQQFAGLPLRCHSNKGGGSQRTGPGSLPGGWPQGPSFANTCPFHEASQGWPAGLFFSAPLWSLPFPGSARLSPSPGSRLESGHPSQDSRDTECASSGPLLSALLLEAWGPGGRQEPEGAQGGGLFRDAPRHVPHTQWEPAEAAHNEGVGAPRSSPRPLAP